MTSQDYKKLNLPDSPGVYFFKKKRKILYVGKATSLKDRVKSYFSRDLIRTRGPLLVRMLEESDSVAFEIADSVLEALILEAHYIKKFQPFHNSISKDDKSYNYVVITKEKFPRILTMRETELFRMRNGESRIVKNLSRSNQFLIPHSSFTIRFMAGPFPHGQQLREALKIIRRIFPYRDLKCNPDQGRPCFNRQIGLCPGVCTGEISEKEYKKTIKNIELFFQGKKAQIVKNLEREMKSLAKAKEFEKANIAKRQIFALNHIQDVALLKQENLKPKTYNLKPEFRIESYDIAHMSGKETVGVMVVIENGEVNKNEYRKFKIKGTDGVVEVDDTKNLREILQRRFKHTEWVKPDLIVIDGGVGQLNTAKEVLKVLNLNIEIVSVVKNERHRPREILGNQKIIKMLEKSILLSNNEAHRFAISYHKNLRNRAFRGLK